MIEDAQGRVVARLSDYLGRQTNNHAEYQGLLAVLDWALEHGVKRLRVVSDSELMVNQMKGRYKVASPVLRPLWEEAKRRAARLESLEMQHTLRGGNQEADRLANEAMDRGMGKSGASGGTHTAATPSGAGTTKPETERGQRQVIEGYVQGGVVHLLDGVIPEGTFVTIHRKS